MCLKYFVDAGAMAVRRVVKKDLKRIAKASGGMCIWIYFCIKTAVKVLGTDFENTAC